SPGPAGSRRGHLSGPARAPRAAHGRCDFSFFRALSRPRGILPRQGPGCSSPARPGRSPRITRCRMRRLTMAFYLPFLCLGTGAARAEPLPGTRPLTGEGDLAARMVEGIDKYLMRELGASAEK